MEMNKNKTFKEQQRVRKANLVEHSFNASVEF